MNINSEEEFDKAFAACKTRAEREALMAEIGADFRSQGQGIMDGETLEIVLMFCDVAVKTVLATLAGALAHPDSDLKALDSRMLSELSQNPPPVVRDAVFKMIDIMGLDIGDPFADPQMTDAALTAILDQGAK